MDANCQGRVTPGRELVMVECRSPRKPTMVLQVVGAMAASVMIIAVMYNLERYFNWDG